MITITTAYFLSLLVFSVSGFCDMNATGAIKPSEADNIPVGQCEFYIDLHGWPYYLTNPNNCSQFWECTVAGDICLYECTHCQYPDLCPETGALYFDPELQYPVGPACNWPNTIECTNPWVTTTTTTTTTTPACPLPCQQYVNGQCQPECCTDPDCSTGQLCDSTGHCVIGCRNHTQCEGWNSNCPGCMWCDRPENIEIGTCVPGCLVDEQCGTNEKCVDHECIGCPLPCQTLNANAVCEPECCEHSDCQNPETPLCNADGLCVAGCLEMADCDGSTVTCKQPWAQDPNNCEYCGNINPEDGIGECLPGCDISHNLCPADFPTCDASNHHCNSVGQIVIDKIRLITGTCVGCDKNNEGGAVIHVWGKKALNCTTGNLDKANWVDYENGQTAEFESGIDISQMGACNNAALRPDSATITWTGQGTWTPTDVTLLDNEGYKNICQLPGTGLTNGQSFTVKCPQE